MSSITSYVLKRTVATLFIVINALLCGIGFAVLANLILPNNKIIPGLFIIGLPITALVLMISVYKKEYLSKIKNQQ